MKKKISFLLIAAIMCIIPAFNVKADVEPTNLAEAVKEELSLIGDDDTYATEAKTLKKFDTKNYQSGNAKVTVYIFRGSTCPHCLDAVTHFASIYSDYKDKMDVITYEVYNNSDNASLMSSVGDALGADTTGVPLIVIGEKYFSGYGESLDDQIATAIDDAYNNDNYVDVVQGVINGTYEGGSSTADEDEDDSKSNVVGYVILGITVVIIALIIISRGKESSYYDVEDAEETVTEEVKEEKAPAKEEKKETVKKTTKTSTTKKATTTKKKTTKKNTKK